MDFIQVNIGWHNSTFIFYMILILMCYFCTAATRNYTLVLNKHKQLQAWIIVPAIALVFVKGFGTTGRDLRAGYYYNFVRASSMKEFPDQSVEIGYRFLNVIIRNITDNYSIFIFVIACLSIFPVLKFLNKYKNNIDLPIAVLMYSSIFFVNGFSPLRQSLAAALALFAYDAMVERKPIKSLVWIIAASLFHAAALVLIIPYLFSLIKVLDKRLIALTLISAFFAGYMGRKSLAALMAKSDRYYVYESFDKISFGFEQLAYFLPFFIVFFFGAMKDANKQLTRIAFSYLTTAFCFGMLGYVISIFGRFRDVFLPIIFIIPYYICRIKKLYPGKKAIINVLAAAYCLLRFYIYITQYYNMEDLMPYTNIFGWVI